MFETQPILWLQSLASPTLDALMLAISQLGYSFAYGALLLSLGFAVRLRPALLLMLALVLTSAFTHVIKTEAGLPRPSDVDARVLDNTRTHSSLTTRGGAATFFKLPATDSIARARAAPRPNFGFVSGHTSGAAALAVAMVLAFGLRRRWLQIAVLAWPVLMGLSRMYLGRHFLADVLGGLLLGAAVAAALCIALRGKPGADVPECRAPLLWTAMACVTLLTLALWPSLSPILFTEALGLLLAWLVWAWRGFPVETKQWKARLLRLTLAIGVFAAVGLAFRGIEQSLLVSTPPMATAFLRGLSLALALLISVFLAQRFGLYGASSKTAPAR